MPILKRHREINNLMKEKGLWEELHALQICAWTEKQWEEKKKGSIKLIENEVDNIFAWER